MTLPAALDNIGNYAFKISGLTRVICYATTPPWFDAQDIEVFTSSGSMTLYVPNSAVSTFQDKDYWKTFGTITAITEEATIENLRYVLNNPYLTAEVTYENSTSPRYSSLPSFLSIPSTVSYNSKNFTVTSIGSDAFGGSTGLASVFTQVRDNDIQLGDITVRHELSGGHSLVA